MVSEFFIVIGIHIHGLPNRLGIGRLVIIAHCTELGYFPGRRRVGESEFLIVSSSPIPPDAVITLDLQIAFQKIDFHAKRISHHVVPLDGTAALFEQTFGDHSSVGVVAFVVVRG